MAKPVVKFKTYRQDSRLGGKIYGVANLADPVVADVTMQEVIDYAKLHNYSAATLAALLDQVISGVADLVARDGRPRNLSGLLKFEPTIKGTFKNLEAGITDQKIVIRPRLLKEIRVNIPADTYAWQNQNDTLQPRLISVAPADTHYDTINLASARVGLAVNTGFGWSYAGSRLCPNGWDQNCKFAVTLEQGDTVYHFEQASDCKDASGQEVGIAGNIMSPVGADSATDNVVNLGFDGTNPQCWYFNGANKIVYDGEILPLAGDILTFSFTRTVGSGDTFTVEKSYTL